MQVKLEANSIRIQVDKKEAQELLEKGRVEDFTYLDASQNQYLKYILEKSSVFNIQAKFGLNQIRILIPFSFAENWMLSDRIGLYNIQELSEGVFLKINLEKENPFNLNHCPNTNILKY